MLVRVCAAGMNRIDVLQRQGNYPLPPDASDVLGLELAGVVESLGSGANRFKRGDRVMALVTSGAYADWAVVPGGDCSSHSRRHVFRAGGCFSGDVFHRLEQCLRTGRAEEGRDAPGSRRHLRHRHDGDHAREGLRCPRYRHRRLAGKVRGLPQARRRWRDRLSEAGFCRGLQGNDGGAGTRRDPGYGRRRLHCPRPRGNRLRRPHRPDRLAARFQGGDRSEFAAEKAGDVDWFVAAFAAIGR